MLVQMDAAQFGNHMFVGPNFTSSNRFSDAKEGVVARRRGNNARKPKTFFPESMPRIEPPPHDSWLFLVGVPEVWGITGGVSVQL